MSKLKIHIKADRLFAILAFIVSVSTLYVFFYQTSLMKKQQYASVLPYLSIANTQIDGNYSFILVNNGIGPAFIDKMNIYYNDTIYRDKDINDFYNEIIKKEDTIFNSKGITFYDKKRHVNSRKGYKVYVYASS